MSPRHLLLWQRLQTVTDALRREVGRELKDAGLSEPEFAVLAGLAALGGSARPSACATRIGWDSSRMSHQLGRLEKRGLVARNADDGDGRASVVSLTPAGRAAHRTAVGPHLRAATYWFADALDDATTDALDAALTALAAHLDTTPTVHRGADERMPR